MDSIHKVSLPKPNRVANILTQQVSKIQCFKEPAKKIEETPKSIFALQM